MYAYFTSPAGRARDLKYALPSLFPFSLTPSPHLLGNSGYLVAQDLFPTEAKAHRTNKRRGTCSPGLLSLLVMGFP